MSAATQTPAGLQEMAGPTTTDILEAIKSCNEAIKTCKDTLMVKIDYLVTDISLICHDLDKFRSCVPEAEDRISQMKAYQSRLQGHACLTATGKGTPGEGHRHRKQA